MEKESTITFSHPDYPDELHQNILFRFNAFDDNNDYPGSRYGTALNTCAIVAGNACDR